jgi:hypothetical protein
LVFSLTDKRYFVEQDNVIYFKVRYSASCVTKERHRLSRRRAKAAIHLPVESVFAALGSLLRRGIPESFMAALALPRGKIFLSFFLWCKRQSLLL